jgi:hypothetical protein
MDCVRSLARAAAPLAFAVLASCASEPPQHHRWNPNGTPRDENWHSPATSLLKYDADHDGTLTRAELEAGLHKEFDSFDTKHTGCLTSDQVIAINQARQSEDQAAASPVIDWKQNGCVDFDEFAATARSLFESLDKNGDGKLTPDEINPKPQQQHRQGGQGGFGRHRHGGGGGDKGGGQQGQ